MSSDIVIESVPRFVRRYGDQVFEGSNNTIIIFGTDRASKGPASIGDGLGHVNASNGGKGTGTIHLIAGRKASDPDLTGDDSFLYLTRKSKFDDNLGLTGVESAKNDSSAAVMKSDSIRIIGRNDIKICANDDEKHYVFMDGKKIKIVFGSNFVEINDNKLTIDFGKSKITATTEGEIRAVNAQCEVTLDTKRILAKGPHFKLGGGAATEWKSLLNSIMFMIANHGHMTPVGPSLPAGLGPSAIVGTSLGPVVPGAHPITAIQWPAAASKLAELSSQCFE